MDRQARRGLKANKARRIQARLAVERRTRERVFHWNRATPNQTLSNPDLLVRPPSLQPCPPLWSPDLLCPPPWSPTLLFFHTETTMSCPTPPVDPTADPLPPVELDDRYSAYRYAIASLYYVLFAWLVYLLWRQRTAPARRWQKSFYIFVTLASAGRAAFFPLQPSIYNGNIDVRNCVNSLLSVIPSLFFFSAYFVLIFFWCGPGPLPPPPRSLAPRRQTSLTCAAPTCLCRTGPRSITTPPCKRRKGRRSAGSGRRTSASTSPCTSSSPSSTPSTSASASRPTSSATRPSPPSTPPFRFCEKQDRASNTAISRQAHIASGSAHNSPSWWRRACWRAST